MRHVPAGAAALACAGLLAACGAAPVPVEDAPQAGPECASLLERLPSTVGNAVRRDVEPSGAAAAAWGDPPVVLRCGVEVPDLVGEECLVVNGVGWVVRSSSDEATVLAAFGREPSVEVTVPAAHPGMTTEPLAGLADALGSLPELSACL